MDPLGSQIQDKIQKKEQDNLSGYTAFLTIPWLLCKKQQQPDSTKGLKSIKTLMNKDLKDMIKNSATGFDKHL